MKALIVTVLIAVLTVIGLELTALHLRELSLTPQDPYGSGSGARLLFSTPC